MKLSVLIPARNEEAYIGSCLQSIKDAAGKITAVVLRPLLKKPRLQFESRAFLVGKIESQ